MSADAAAPGAAPAPALSVIVVNYNVGDLLADCLAAVLTSAVAVKVIVSDNCCVYLCNRATTPLGRRRLLCFDLPARNAGGLR